MSSEPETKPAAGAAPAWKPWVGRGLRALLALFVVNAALGLASAWTAGGTGAVGPRAILLHPHSPAALGGGIQGGTAVWLVVGLLLALGLVLFVRLGAAIATLLAVALVWGTLASAGADLWGDVAHGRLLLLALVLACWGGVLLLGAIRWGVLLSVQGIRLPLSALLRLTLIGHFFNTSLPGAVTGDLLKIGYVSDHSGRRQAEAVLTIFLDRIIGVLGLCIVAGAMVLASLSVLRELGDRSPYLQAGAYTVGLGSVGGIVFVLLVEARGWLVRFAPVGFLVRLGARLLPAQAVGMVERLVAAIELYRGRRGATLRALALAVGVHLLLGLGLYCAGRGIRETGLGLRDYFLAAQVANTVAAIPVTPGGVGTRDLVAKEYFAVLGVHPVGKEGTIPVLMTLAMVAWALLGALVFVLFPRRKPREDAGSGNRPAPDCPRGVSSSGLRPPPGSSRRSHDPLGGRHGEATPPPLPAPGEPRAAWGPRGRRDAPPPPPRGAGGGRGGYAGGVGSTAGNRPSSLHRGKLGGGGSGRHGTRMKPPCDCPPRG